MSVGELQFDFMLERAVYCSIAVFILRRMQEAYHAREQNCIYVVWTYRKVLTEYQGKCWNWH